LLFGATSGYPYSLMTQLAEHILPQYGVYLNMYASSELYGKGRPYPYMIWENLSKLKIENPKCVLKVDDTVSGIQEGHNAGCWTCAAYGTSVYMDIDSMTDYYSMNKNLIKSKEEKSKRKFLQESQPHFLIHN